MADEKTPKREFTGEQLMKIFEDAINAGRAEEDAAPVLFEKGEGMEQVPAGNDSALDDL